MNKLMNEKKDERHFIVVVSGDANDADYITKTTFITTAQLPEIQKLTQAMDAFDKELEGKVSDDELCNMDYCREFRKWAERSEDPGVKEALGVMGKYLPRDPGFGEFPHDLTEFRVYELASPTPLDLQTIEQLSTPLLTNKKETV